MLLFAHAGITLGAGILLDEALFGNQPFSAGSKSWSSPCVLSAHDCSLQNGRIFPHTLRFTIFLAILGTYVYKRRIIQAVNINAFVRNGLVG